MRGGEKRRGIKIEGKVTGSRREGGPKATIVQHEGRVANYVLTYGKIIVPILRME